jgi:putative FmdB family regulatory protein
MRRCAVPGRFGVDELSWDFVVPIYAYKCSACGHAQDVLQKMSDPLLTVCPECGKSTYEKQVTAAGFRLKGTGWYVTDFRDGGSGSGGSSESGAHHDGSKSKNSEKSSDSKTSSDSTSSASANGGSSSGGSATPAASPAPATHAASAASSSGGSAGSPPAK